MKKLMLTAWIALFTVSAATACPRVLTKEGTKEALTMVDDTIASEKKLRPAQDAQLVRAKILRDAAAAALDRGEDQAAARFLSEVMTVLNYERAPTRSLSSQACFAWKKK